MRRFGQKNEQGGLMQAMYRSPFVAPRYLLLLIVFLLPACASDNAQLRANSGCPSISTQQMTKSKYAATALAYLKANPGEHRVTEPNRELTFLCEDVDELQQKHVRFQQSYEGVPVWGQQVIVHLSAQDQATSTSGRIEPIAQKIPTKPKLDKTVASATAANAAGEGWKAQDSMLYVYPHQGEPRLAHLVNVSKGLQRAMIFVDAETGLVLNQISASPSTN
jgi:bacillolysin